MTYRDVYKTQTRYELLLEAGAKYERAL